ncbi:YdcF family protein [Leptolyngbya ohadii]|uniref:YdcF family protein n=1 Tax=Leptolyngbya ohadii TaxID=1962290 RepID=UPI000B59E03C|nr:YdcF family protein [Leptolyngbya ohadii]
MAFLQRAAQSRPRPSVIPGWKSSRIICGIVLTIAVSYIPARLAIAKWQSPQPQAILTLGGRPAREAYTADFARHHPELKIWVSSGLSPANSHRLFHKAGIATDRIYLDYRASDTVTNFTTLVKDLDRQNIHHIYLITSDYHMTRAQAIATVVLGSHGIAFTPIVIPSDRPPEDQLRTIRDIIRSLIWLTTGYTGANLKP